MSRGKGPAVGTKEFQKAAALAASTVPLSESETKGLLDEKQQLQTLITEASDKDRAVGIDISQVQARIHKIDETMEKRSVPILKGSAKDRLMAEERELADKIARGIPSHYEMDRPAKNPGAVDKNLAWGKRNEANIRRWVEVQNAKVAMGEERTYIDSLRREK